MACRTSSTTWMIIFTAGPADTGECQDNIGNMVQVCRDLGFAVNPSKVTPPASVTNFLGIDIDSVHGDAHIDPSAYRLFHKS